MVDINECKKCEYTDFLIVSTNNNEWHEVDGYKHIETIDDLEYCQIILESGTIVNIVLSKDDLEMLIDDLLI